MAIFQVAGTVTDNAGLQTPFTGTITTQNTAPIVDSVVVSPQSAPTGTLRTITVTAHDLEGGPLTYTCFVEGVAATPTAQPNVFTYMA